MDMRTYGTLQCFEYQKDRTAVAKCVRGPSTIYLVAKLIFCASLAGFTYS